MTNSSPTCGGEFLEQFLGKFLLLVNRDAEAEAEFRVVLEQRIAPRRAAAAFVRRVRRGRQVAAVDRGAARRVGDDRAVAEQLREHLDVRRLAAARARAAELKQRLQQLLLAQRGRLDLAPVEFRQREEKIPVVMLPPRATAPAAAC